MPSFTSSPADTGFTPRKEFIREHRTTANVFSLLALSGSSCVRLFAFPLPLVSALRRLFDQASLTIAVREDTTLNLCEFVLDGKPWANSKSVKSEQLLMDILSVIYQHGYCFLSTIDYGRERDDRVAIAFSKLCPLSDTSGRSASPVPSSPGQGASGSTTPHSSAKRVAFALSFTSATLLRVISPPLHCTPAILQAIRSSWPRGVVSEKKVAEASYEFKLKGYKWFQEDTFATDSLQHILSILSSLDTHSFSLLTSLSLTRRSRVKDLWIFMGPASSSDQGVMLQDSPAPSVLNSSGEFKRVYGVNPELPQTGHPRRYATDPASPHSHMPVAHTHVRAATEDISYRKGAPRSRFPISVARDFDEQGGVRATLPSVVSSSVENMTGVGAAVSRRGLESGQLQEVIYETSLESDRASPIHPEPRARSRSPPGRQRLLRPVSTRSKTPPLLKSDGHTPTSIPLLSTGQVSPPRSNSVGHILTPGVFCDSATSSGDISEIPVKWGEDKRDKEESQDREKDGVKSLTERSIPGGWATPVEERPEAASVEVVGANQDDDQGQPVQEVASRVALPEVRRPKEGTRKSETGSVGMIQPPSTPPPKPLSNNKVKGKEVQSEGGAQGWVLVNVEGKKTGVTEPLRQSSRSPEPLSLNVSPRTPNGNPSVSAPRTGQKKTSMQSVASAAADTKSRSRSKTEGLSLGLRRIFGLKRKQDPRKNEG